MRLKANLYRFVALLYLLGAIEIVASDRHELIYAQSGGDLPQLNAPFFPGEITFGERAIFWFGQVTPTSNYADVRVGYNTDVLVIEASIFDRQLWNDETPSSDSLTEWDAMTLYLSTDSLPGSALTDAEHQVVIQFNPFNNEADYLAVYEGSTNGWQPSSREFSSFVGWRGQGHNNADLDASGWRAAFIIPFAELALSGAPASGTLWHMGLTLHDRDDASGTDIPLQAWPTGMAENTPSTWGKLHFGQPDYESPSGDPGEVITITHGQDGANVVDAHVGGHSICGGPYHPNFFDGWGDANYAGYAQINIQNQSDVADWPCFSKYYVTFPLDLVPAGRTILAAELVMHQFGNADPSGATPSLIQIMTVAEDWDESTITWNNGPLAAENVAKTWVNVITDFNAPPVAYRWDVSRALVESYDAGQPLRLALYSADSDYHSGKYFWASGTDPVVQPRLEITLAQVDGTATATPAETATPVETATPEPSFTPVPTGMTSTPVPLTDIPLTDIPSTELPPTDTPVSSGTATVAPTVDQTAVPTSNSLTPTPTVNPTVMPTASLTTAPTVTPTFESIATEEPGGTLHPLPKNIIHLPLIEGR